MRAWLLATFLISCTDVEQNSENTLDVLTYSSFLGKGSAAELLSEKFDSKKTKLNFIETPENVSIESEYSRLLRVGKNVDLLLGVSSYSLKKLNNIGEEGVFVYSQSPMVLMVQNSRLPPKTNLSFETWRDLLKQQAFHKKFYVQDPRFSEPGRLWLYQINNSSAAPAEISKLMAKSFPSWSASFSAFESTNVWGLWTYASSLSYFECNGQKDEFSFVDIKEGYVEALEHAVIVGDNKSESKRFVQILLSGEVQKELSKRSWMYPAAIDTVPGDCFLPRSLFSTKGLSFSSVGEETFSEWLDKWLLL